MQLPTSLQATLANPAHTPPNRPATRHQQSPLRRMCRSVVVFRGVDGELSQAGQVLQRPRQVLGFKLHSYTLTYTYMHTYLHYLRALTDRQPARQTDRYIYIYIYTHTCACTFCLKLSIMNECKHKCASRKSAMCVCVGMYIYICLYPSISTSF